jgi:hypothetical protein
VVCRDPNLSLQQQLVLMVSYFLYPSVILILSLLTINRTLRNRTNIGLISAIFRADGQIPLHLLLQGFGFDLLWHHFA